MYNPQTHVYTDMKGNVLLSGSQYAKKPEFNKELILPMVSQKHGVGEELLDDMWTANGNISRTFGNTIHYVMEQWFKHKDHGTEKEYHLPKHPFLRGVVESFPDKDVEGIPEAIVSCVEEGMAGTIDLIQILGEKKCGILDYKMDAIIKKNLKYHFKQLSFYAFILQYFGWEVAFIKVWNYTDEWTKYESEILKLKL